MWVVGTITLVFVKMDILVMDGLVFPYQVRIYYALYLPQSMLTVVGEIYGLKQNETTTSHIDLCSQTHFSNNFQIKKNKK